LFLDGKNGLDERISLSSIRSVGFKWEFSFLRSKKHFRRQNFLFLDEKNVLGERISLSQIRSAVFKREFSFWGQKNILEDRIFCF